MRPHALLVLALMLLGLGCRNSQGSDNLRSSDPVVKDGLTPKVSRSINQFGLDYLRTVQASQGDKSFAASPFGVYTTLTVFATSAEGKTLSGLFDALKVKDPSVGELGDGVEQVQDSMYGTAKIPYASHSGIFMIWPVYLDKTFQQQVKDDLRVDITKLGSAGIGSRNQMNDWVSQRTDKKMSGMVDSLDKETIFLALNPVVIGGEWREGFDSSLTSDRVFHATAGEQTLPVMERNGRFRVAETEEWIAVTLNYQESIAEATFVLPKTGTPQELLDDLTADGYLKMTGGREREATLRLPKFRQETNLELKQLAEPLGIKFLFDSKVDFRYMASELQGKYELGAWRQRVLATFEERGSPPAKAGTGQGQVISFDRPFLWFISEGALKHIVASGIYSGQDPTK